MNKKLWFNGECRVVRKNFYLVKCIYKKCQLFENKDNFKEMSKKYKYIIDKCIKGYKMDLIRKFKNLCFINFKEYWKILNILKLLNKCVVDINNMFDYLRGINDCENDDEFNIEYSDFLLNVEIEMFDVIFNSIIGDEEILEVVKKFKNNKVVGYDEVFNEYILVIVFLFLFLYNKLFNIIFDNGFIFDEWFVGIVKFIYKNKGDLIYFENYRLIILLSCLGKFFICILSNRLEIYVLEIDVISESQVGFQKKII